MRKFLMAIALSIPLVAAADDKPEQPAHEHSAAAQPGMSCGHMKEMMAQMEKADSMSVEQKAAAFDAHMKHMREMKAKHATMREAKHQ